MYNYDLGSGFNWDLSGGIRYDSEEYRKNVLRRTCKYDAGGNPYHEKKNGRFTTGPRGRQLELYIKYKTEENILLYASSEELKEWGDLKKDIGFDENEIKKRIASKPSNWKKSVEETVQRGNPGAQIVESRLLDQWENDSKKMTEDEISALRFWTSNEFGKISEHNREGNGNAEVREKDRLMQSALDKTETKDTLYLRRGIGKSRIESIMSGVEGWEDDPKKAIGHEYKESSYIAATPFVNGSQGGQHHIYFKVPPGAKGTYIKQISHAADELEFLLQKGTKGKIVDVKIAEKDEKWGDIRYDIYVEVIV